MAGLGPNRGAAFGLYRHSVCRVHVVAVALYALHFTFHTDLAGTRLPAEVSGNITLVVLERAELLASGRNRQGGCRYSELGALRPLSVCVAVAGVVSHVGLIPSQWHTPEGSILNFLQNIFTMEGRRPLHWVYLGKSHGNRWCGCEEFIRWQALDAYAHPGPLRFHPGSVGGPAGFRPSLRLGPCAQQTSFVGASFRQAGWRAAGPVGPHLGWLRRTRGWKHYAHAHALQLQLHFRRGDQPSALGPRTEADLCPRGSCHIGWYRL